MNPEHESQREELKDRLLKQALREALSGERPPDLSEKILAAAQAAGLTEAPPVEKERVMQEPARGKRWTWKHWTIAAGLLIAVGTVVFISQERRMYRMAARSAPAAGEAATPEPAPASAPRSDSAATLEEEFALNSAARYAPEPSIQQQGEGAPSPGLSAQQPVFTPQNERMLSELREWKAIVPADMPPQEGQGPGRAGDRYTRINENPFQSVKAHPLSTFSIDVDTASYTNVRSFLLNDNRLPPADAVRIEELVNYFDYDYSPPSDSVPFAAHVETAGCPWQPEHRLVRVALKGKEIPRDERGASNLVFLLDVSGSMNEPNKLPLVREGMRLLAEQLGENDRVAIVVYAGQEGLVLSSTPGSRSEEIIAVLDQLQAGGSTNGGAGIRLAYKVAQENFIPDGVNRVILCTDGDFNVGTTSAAELERLVEEKARTGVFLTVLGFGRGNLNDAMMESISNKGNGNYGYIDNLTEARKMLVEQMAGTLVTIAKDVKIQIEFNPAQVAGYRLIGYENRMLAKEDFNDDKKDAGEIGAGHTVTALYEIVPAGKQVPAGNVDPLKYQQPVETNAAAVSNELLTLKLRYKEPDGDTSKLLEFPVTDSGQRFAQASGDFKFASAVAGFGMLLRDSAHRGNITWDAVLEIAREGQGADRHGYRAEFLQMVERAKQLSP